MWRWRCSACLSALRCGKLLQYNSYNNDLERLTHRSWCTQKYPSSETIWMTKESLTNLNEKCEFENGFVFVQQACPYISSWYPSLSQCHKSCRAWNWESTQTVWCNKKKKLWLKIREKELNSKSLDKNSLLVSERHEFILATVAELCIARSGNADTKPWIFHSICFGVFSVPISVDGQLQSSQSSQSSGW